MSNTWIVCIDGTWNAPGNGDRDPTSEKEYVTSTNVVKAWESLTSLKLERTQHYGKIAPLAWPQVGSGAGEVVYYNGIGTTGTYEKYFEGATGSGTSERICDAYRFIAERHQDGDRIYLFGFSRGAFAVRSLAGMIQCAGLPEQPRHLNEDDLKDLYMRYRERQNVPGPQIIGSRPVHVNFIGAWDTVGAIAFGKSFNNFHQTSPANVARVAHALALDEIRSVFHPTFWENSDGAGTVVREVWFSGAHANIGGGYFDTNLSDIAFFWVMREAKAAGLDFDPRQWPGFDGELAMANRRNSYLEFYENIHVIGNMIAELADAFQIGKNQRNVMASQYLHESVLERMNSGTDQIADEPARKYIPAALFEGKPMLPNCGIAIEPWGFF